MIKTNPREEAEQVILESALMKWHRGEVMQPDQANEQAAEFLKRFDLVWAFWPEPRNPSGLGASIVRHAKVKKANLRGQSIMCADRATGLKLHTLCRGPDNHAPKPPGGPASATRRASDRLLKVLTLAAFVLIAAVLIGAIP